jgi:excisionase family DNA binding protein
VGVNTPIFEGQGGAVIGQLLYSIPQASRVIGISERLCWIFVQRGEIRTRRVGSRVLIHRRELERFALRDHKGTAAESEAA